MPHFHLSLSSYRALSSMHKQYYKGKKWLTIFIIYISTGIGISVNLGLSINIFQIIKIPIYVFLQFLRNPNY